MWIKELFLMSCLFAVFEICHRSHSPLCSLFQIPKPTKIQVKIAQLILSPLLNSANVAGGWSLICQPPGSLREEKNDSGDNTMSPLSFFSFVSGLNKAGRRHKWLENHGFRVSPWKQKTCFANSNPIFVSASAPQGRRITLWHQFSKERTVPSRSLSFCLHAALSFILFYPC